MKTIILAFYCYVSIKYKQEKNQVSIIPTLNNVISITIS